MHKDVARELALRLKNKPWRTGSPYVCMGTVHACALVKYPVSREWHSRWSSKPNSKK